jgi:pilus assembly protein Flp/PilA
VIETLARLIKDEEGATAMEWGLIAALVAIVAVVAMTAVGTGLGSVFGRVSTKL